VLVCAVSRGDPYFRLIVLRAAGADVGEAEVAFARAARAIAEAISGPYVRAVSQTALAMAYLGVGRFTESVEANLDGGPPAGRGG
jgi:hypothetical protein